MYLFFFFIKIRLWPPELTARARSFNPDIHLWHNHMIQGNLIFIAFGQQSSDAGVTLIDTILMNHFDGSAFAFEAIAQVNTL